MLDINFLRNGSIINKFIIFLAILVAFISLGYFEEKPQHNAYIERFNGILQKEFINHHLSLAFQNLEEFNNKLLDYLFWHNTKNIIL